MTPFCTGSMFNRWRLEGANDQIEAHIILIPLNQNNPKQDRVNIIRDMPYILQIPDGQWNEIRIHMLFCNVFLEITRGIARQHMSMFYVRRINRWAIVCRRIEIHTVSTLPPFLHLWYRVCHWLSVMTAEKQDGRDIIFDCRENELTRSDWTFLFTWKSDSYILKMNVE